MKNPYSAANPDATLGLIRRPEVNERLDSWLVNSAETQLAAIIAERGMGGAAAVRRYLDDHAADLPLRIVHCDLKADLGKGDSPLDFYRNLALFVFDRLEEPSALSRLAARLRAADLASSDELARSDAFGKDFFEFFQKLKEDAPDRPLLLALYNFDRLPRQFPFSGTDLAWLRVLHDDEAYRLYYVVVSRRDLGYVERLHGLEDSLFATRFGGHVRRIGLLSDVEAGRLIRAAERTGTPWPAWLPEFLRRWGGNHPYCLQYVCFEMYERLFNRGESLERAAAEKLSDEWLRPEYFGDYFERLYQSLKRDRLLEPLVRAVRHGYHSPHHAELLELVETGYFARDGSATPLQQREYRLFSPLFHDFLTQRGAFLTGALPDDGPPPGWPPPQLSLSGPLTPREREALWHMAHGIIADGDLAAKMTIASQTAHDYVTKVMYKLAVSKRADAALAAKGVLPRQDG